jgi:GntR family transcriptional regulator
MTIRVRPDSPDPIYEQIAGQVVFAVASGDLAPGELIPSVRDLAVQLTVNPNTVTRAFQELERLGVIAARRGLGMAVTPDAPQLCRNRRKELIRDRVRETVREASSAGLQATDVHKLIDDEWPRKSPH